tara:strand:- start:524 stop:1522 length:999 start_codon:yes stop_codon:yes gene_type:complete
MIKKKGRRPKSYYENLKLDSCNTIIDTKNENINTTNSINDLSANNLFDLSTNTLIDLSNIKVPKKRGRKPKGGKIVEIKDILVTNIPKPNVILHLNCFLHEIINIDVIKYKPDIENIDTYNLHETNNFINFNFIKNNNQDSSYNNIDKETNNENNNSKISIPIDDTYNRKNINRKLKELSFNLKNDIINKKSSCFWCTYEFDNEAIHIPTSFNNNTNSYNCYGCFCSPECACSFLMNDSSIDSSSKFERYYLLNNVYGKIYNYKKNIKPAPSPHYLLKKFYGNLDIQEYRKLLNYERLLLVIEKPLTKSIPEIFEENDDYLINTKILSKSQK